MILIVAMYETSCRFTYIVLELGRTAWAGRTGVAISFVTQYEWEWYLQIEEHTGMQHMLQSLMTRYEEAYSFVLVQET